MLKHAVIGAGFWSNFQVAGWGEVKGVKTVAICDLSEEKAGVLARKFAVPGIYTDVDKMLTETQPDVVDVITTVESHAPLVRKVADYGIDIICQKPMSVDLDQSRAMVDYCNSKGVKFYIHENFRWQSPLRKLKEILDSGVIGKVFKSRVTFCSAFPVFDNQPALAALEQFILTDIGTHTLDICRFLFGEAKNLHCMTARINPKIKGEDVANCFMEMADGSHCYVEMSYASILEKEAFPQTFVLAEGNKGSVKLEHDCKIKVTTREGTTEVTALPPTYGWVDPAYAVAQASIVACNENLYRGLTGGGKAETTGEDNLKTLELVFGSYESAASGRIVRL